MAIKKGGNLILMLRRGQTWTIVNVRNVERPGADAQSTP
jgi:hypothetical protein